MILTGKLRTPEIKEHIVQKQAVKDAVSAQACRCIIVKAMGGFGKTVLFANAAAERAVLWYTLDASDADAGRFLDNLEYLWAQADGKAAGEERDFYDRLCALAGRTADWEREWFLVLDNVQEITGTQSVRLLQLLSVYAAERLRVIMLTRELPQGFQKQLLRGEAMLITEKQLRLTEEEAAEWLAGSGLSSQTIGRLVKELAGWPAAVAAAARCLEQGETKWQQILEKSGLAAYLDELFWNPLGAADRAFFAQTAALGSFSWELCSGLLVPQPARADFDRLTAYAGGFVSVGKDGGSYTYGKAFGCYLQSKLNGDQKEELAARAACWYRARGDINRMISFAVRGKQDILLAEELEQDGRRLLRELEPEIFYSLSDYLERSALLLPPEASGVLAQLFYREGQYNRMEDCLNAADSAFGKENKYSCYRSLYRALQHFDEDKTKYEKQIYNALFFLNEEKEKLPFLTGRDQRRLEQLQRKEHTESAQRRLSVKMFGAFRVFVCEDGHEIAWRTRKGRELFAYLLALEGQAAERRELMDVLWREEIPDHAVAMLHNMIYNIRKELSAYCLDGILVYENKKYCLKTDEILCNTSEILQVVQHADKGDVEALKADYGVLETYWGSYMEDIDSLWAEQKRRYYDEMYMKGCFLLAKRYVEEKSYEYAQKLCQNILLLDPYSERAEELILLSYGRQKRWERVKTCYREFSDRLKKELDVSPGAEVEAAYHQYFR